MEDFEPRKRYRYDKEMDEIIEIRPNSNYPEPDKNIRDARCVSDIEPYRAIASDVAANGLRPVIGGRRQHREFLNRNGYTEVGNDFVPNHRVGPSDREIQRDRVMDIKRVLGE